MRHTSFQSHFGSLPVSLPPPSPPPHSPSLLAPRGPGRRCALKCSGGADRRVDYMHHAPHSAAGRCARLFSQQARPLTPAASCSRPTCPSYTNTPTHSPRAPRRGLQSRQSNTTPVQASPQTLRLAAAQCRQRRSFFKAALTQSRKRLKHYQGGIHPSPCPASAMPPPPRLACALGCDDKPDRAPQAYKRRRATHADKAIASYILLKHALPQNAPRQPLARRSHPTESPSTHCLRCQQHREQQPT